jgi:hypothetical protein
VADALRASTVLRTILPPWLRRKNGFRLMGALADVLDDVIDRTALAVAARFPTDVAAPDALAGIGADRRIRRGPAEGAVTYARRLRGWWDAHKRRGSPYALLGQLFAYWRDTFPMRIDAVAQSGLRHVMAVDGSITRDEIVWDGNGDHDGDPDLLAANAGPGDLELRPVTLDVFPSDEVLTLELNDGAGNTEIVTAIGTSTDPYPHIILSTPVVGTYLAGPSTVRILGVKWAHLWLFFYVTGFFTTLVTAADEVLVTDAGDTLIATDVFSGVISDAEAEQFRAIPREWSAAHLPYITIVLLYDDPDTGASARLWNYPQPVPTWTAWEASGALWGSPEPIILLTE